MMSQERTERVRQIVVEYNDPRPFNDAAEMGEMLRELIVLLTPDKDSDQIYIFQWSTHHPACVDCGNPAPFYSDRYDLDSEPGSLCAICAANDAAEGMTITRRVPLD